MTRKKGGKKSRRGGNSRRSKKGSNLPQAALRYRMEKLFVASPRRRFGVKEVISKMRITNNRDSVNAALEFLTNKNIISAVANNKYVLNKKLAKEKADVFVGNLEIIRSGAGYVAVEELKDDIYIPAKYLNSALNGDKIEVMVFSYKTGRKPEGEITNILERANKKIVGKLNSFRNEHVVTPSGNKMDFSINIHPDDVSGAEDGNMVVVEITQYPKNRFQKFRGKIIADLGSQGSADAEMKSILINAGFDIVFPPEVMEESKSLNDKITKQDLADRLDMRDVLTFTIDPADAKDFDDAISYKEVENGYEIGVHIADVTHFVKEGTELDKEAYNRSTSVYLVDRVLPMLPEKISNELCSLRPNEDKFTFSVIFTFDKNYKIIKTDFAKTLTHSDRRFTYDEAQEVIETGKGDFVKQLRKINEIATHYRKKRFKTGSISFEMDEVKFVLDENSKPIDVYVKERKDAHLLIEDLMLLANKSVALFMSNKKTIPYIYRIHDVPNTEKVNEFVQFCREFGFKIDNSNGIALKKSFNDLGEAAKKDDSLSILVPLAVRTMSKAVYSAENIGHYGLGFEYYSHFTSPIRRYADVIAHRLLAKNIDASFKMDKELLDGQCKHISTQERNAIKAERESIKYKQVEFMQDHVGDVFVGVVTGMIERGLFVEVLQTRCEGMVAFNTMSESFRLDDSRLSTSGKKGGSYKIGDKVSVRVLDTNLQKRFIEMEIVNE